MEPAEDVVLESQVLRTRKANDLTSPTKESRRVCKRTARK